MEEQITVSVPTRCSVGPPAGYTLSSVLVHLGLSSTAWLGPETRRVAQEGSSDWLLWVEHYVLNTFTETIPLDGFVVAQRKGHV